MCQPMNLASPLCYVLLNVYVFSLDSAYQWDIFQFKLCSNSCCWVFIHLFILVTWKVHATFTPGLETRIQAVASNGRFMQAHIYAYFELPSSQLLWSHITLYVFRSIFGLYIQNGLPLNARWKIKQLWPIRDSDSVENHGYRPFQFTEVLFIWRI